MKKNNSQNKGFGAIRFLIFGALLFFTWTTSVWSADLKFSPASAKYKVGDTFSVAVILATPNQSANAVSGTISFPVDKLRVSSLSKSGSIINLWAQEPTFSNTSGQIKIEGVILNPGYTGSAGRVITIEFVAKVAGEAIVSFSNGDILANDGAGTSIVNQLLKASYSITNPLPVEPKIIPTPKPTPVPTPKVVESLPSLPIINSSTHPNQSDWYSLRFPELNWTLPDDVTAINFILDDKKDTEPSAIAKDPVDSYTARNELNDGVWYFHLRFKNKTGWGKTAHFVLNIDTTPPESLVVGEIKDSDLTNGKTKFSFGAIDRLSGLDRFEFQIDDASPQSISVDEKDVYETPDLAPGKHKLLVYAIDRAGNKISKELEFDIVVSLERTVFVKWVTSPLVIFSIFIILILLIILLLVISTINWWRMKAIVSGVKKEVHQADAALQAAFKVLRDDLTEKTNQIKNSRTNRQLLPEEEEMIDTLKVDMNESEKYVRREIDSIGDALK